MRSVTINGNQAGQRLDKFLRKLLPEAGAGFLYKMLRKKNITLNGKRAEGAERLIQGDQICLFFSEETYNKFAGKLAEKKGEPGSRGASDLDEYRRAYKALLGINVIYEDDHVLILNKPAGILTQKANDRDISLNEWMIGYLLDQSTDFEAKLTGFRPSVCNRLDRNTSGLVLCGKSLPGLQFLSRCIRERSVRKFYRTICLGQLWEPALVKGYLKKDEGRNRVSVVPQNNCQPNSNILMGHIGEYIETAYIPLCVGEKHTLLEVELITGKPHQIRAHLAGIGHPIIGDFKYGNLGASRKLQQTYGLKHQLLHAFRVEFPKTDEPAGRALSGQIITAPCPEQFTQIQKALGLIT